MKILWFSNTAANGEGFLNNIITIGGWLKSLDKELQLNKNIDLNVAFYHNQKINPFVYGNSKYYPIYSDVKFSNMFSMYFKRVRGTLEPKKDIIKYLDIVDEVKPDLIHIHGTENPFGYISKFIDIPVVISIQGNITVYSHKFFSGFNIMDTLINTSIKDYITGKNYFSIYKKFMNMSIREKEILNISKYIIGRTEWDRRISRILTPNAYYYHADEILRDEFYMNVWKKNSNCNRLIFHTTISGALYKGLETILQTAEILSEKINTKFEWNIAGIEKNSKIVKLFEKKYPRKSSKYSINYLGKIGADLLLKSILSSSIYIHTSHIENSSNGICEAMILGIPVIGTYTGGTSSLLENNKEGILIQDGDPFSLAGAIWDFINNYEIAVKYGQNARQRAISRHNKKIISERMYEIYGEILGKNKSKYKSKSIAYNNN